MMPVYLKEEVSLYIENDIFPSYDAWFPTICYAHY